MPKDTNLSVIILCKNEEDSLAGCIESVLFAETIIVGDDGSSDDTIAVAKHYKADVIKLPEGLDFSQKRNFLMRYAQTEWILFLDADERVTSQLQKQIENEKLKLKYGDQIQGCYIKRSDFFMGRKLKHGETAHTWLLRLARAHAGKWIRPVHEVWNINGSTVKLDGEILHTSHPDLEEFIDKINHYTEFEAKRRNISEPLAYLQLFLYPAAKFIQNYVIRLGFLDGFPGFVMAWMMSLHSLCVRIKVLEKLRAQKT